MYLLHVIGYGRIRFLPQLQLISAAHSPTYRLDLYSTL